MSFYTVYPKPYINIYYILQNIYGVVTPSRCFNRTLRKFQRREEEEREKERERVREYGTRHRGKKSTAKNNVFKAYARTNRRARWMHARNKRGLAKKHINKRSRPRTRACSCAPRRAAPYASCVSRWNPVCRGVFAKPSVCTSRALIPGQRDAIMQRTVGSTLPPLFLSVSLSLSSTAPCGSILSLTLRPSNTIQRRLVRAALRRGSVHHESTSGCDPGLGLRRL